MRRIKLIVIAFSVMMSFAGNIFADDSIMTRFDFLTTSDASGKYTGTLENGASLGKMGDFGILELGKDNGYFDFGSEFGDVISTLGDKFTISVNVYIPKGTSLSSAGNFIWCFANSSSTGYLFMSARESRYAITKTTWNAEEEVSFETAFTKGEWVNVVYIQSDNVGYLYLNFSNSQRNKSMTLRPSDIGKTSMNYLGKSCYSSDSYLAGAKMSDFRIYNYKIKSTQRLALKNINDSINDIQEAMDMMETINTFSLGDVSHLTSDIKLPLSYNDINIKWHTSDASVITNTGKITRPASGQPISTATLTACFSKGIIKDTLLFEVGVMPLFTDAETADLDYESLTLDGNLNNLYYDLILPSAGRNGSAITWKSSDTEYITDEGRVVKYDDNEKKHIVLTATIRRGLEVREKTFDVYLHKNEPYSNYLFVYFPSNSNENIYYAISNDGYNYTVLNNGNMVISCDTTSYMKGLRDPHILRGNDGWFYMAVTDMKCSLGWSSNRGIVLMRSKDLINWQHSLIHFPTRFAGTIFADAVRVWAPETIWDPEYVNVDGSKGRYLVYFSLWNNNSDIPYDIDYCFYVNDDFTDAIGKPVKFFDRGSTTIDMDIVYSETDSLYHAFFSGTGGIFEVTAKTLMPQEGEQPGSQWGNESGPHQQTNVNIEGSGVFKLINEDKWVLMYDCYTSGYYQFCSSDDLQNFKFVRNTQTSGVFTPRHGTVIPITPEETAALLKAFPTSGLSCTAVGANNPNIKQNNMEIESASIFLPVVPGTDISSFDPEIYGGTGTSVSPSTPQDFTAGPVEYTITGSGKSKTYSVSVEVDGNPVLPDFHADPEVLYSKQTGHFYIYPTTDGVANWGGKYFNVYSSTDLLNYTDEGTILNLASGGDVDWSSGNAWAPCIEEKFVDGQWRYFFYFSGQNTELNKKTLGVAVSTSPTGPFIASSSPLFTSSSASQMIDADVFTDPVTGQSYLYYGNGKMCYRLLNDDMTSVKGTEYNITPSGGTLSTYAYREGTYVFYRNGIYYFLWSVDDTGSDNYHVAYGTSVSPTGPITVAADPIVIIQDPSNGIYGTGHNSVINIPGTDDWYIVYHRINKAYRSNGPGYHREVCIDSLTFNADGSIRQVIPTRKGIDPVNMTDINYSILTNVDDVTENLSDDVVSVSYFTINGIPLGQSLPMQKGVYIRKEVLSNGTTRTLKMIAGK